MRNYFTNFFKILVTGIVICCTIPYAFTQDLTEISRDLAAKNSLVARNGVVSKLQQVNPKWDSKSLESMLMELETRYKIHFCFASHLISNKVVDQIEKLNKWGDLDELLDHLLLPLGLQYEKIEEGLYLIFQEKVDAPTRLQKKFSPDIEKNSSPKLIEKLERSGSAWMVNQEKNIRGKVTDENNEGLPGVNILAQGTTIGTVSNVDGTYSLSVPDDVETLVFSSVGYLSEEVSITNQAVINVTLYPDIKSLKEVVVVGYGTQEKKDITSSISSIQGEQLTKVPVSRLDQALQGQMPGVLVTTNDASPGGDVSIRIRGYGTAAAGGDNAPLFVIDGVPTKQGINLLNPNDIESINVLKDAAAASVYGVQASNGVVVITTKRGIAGEPRLTFDTYQGISSAWRNDIEVMNPRQLAAFNNFLFDDYNQSQGNSAGDPGYIDPNPAYADPSSLPAEGTDWQDAIFQNAHLQDYNLGFSGGDEATQFALSAGYRAEEGIILNTDMERYTFRGSLTHEATDYLKVGATFSYSQVKRTGVRTNTGFTAVTTSALTYPGLFPVRRPDGSYGLMPEVNNLYWGDAKNPVAMAERADQTNIDNGINGSVYAEAKLIKGLSFRSFFGFGNWFGSYKNFSRTVLWTDEDYDDPGSLSESSYKNINYNWDNTLTYARAFKNQSINFVIGTSAQYFSSESMNVNQSGFQAKAPQFRYFGFGDPGTFTANSGEGDRSLFSYFGRINYEYANKYLAQIVVRRDGSSVFAKNKRWGTFPAASLGWRLSEERFMQPVEFINDLKLRASWGLSGNQFIGDNYPTYSRLATGVNAVFGNQVYGGVRPSQLGNANVTWENNEQIDFGFDASLFKNHIDLSVDYYKKTTTDMLLKVTLPAIGGTAEPPAQNVGSLINKGVELVLTYKSNPDKDFSYSVSANGATLKNEITSLGDLEFVLPANRIGYEVDDEVTRALVGYPVSSYYGYKFDGIYQNEGEIISGPTPDRTEVQPGDVRWKDISGPDGIPDGAITEDDRTVLGDAIPDLSYGLNFTANYKNFDLSIFFWGVSGVEIYSAIYRAATDLSGGRNGLTDILNYWKDEGSTNKYPRASNFNDPANNLRVSDRYIFDGDYLRLRNLQIGYSLPSSVLERVKMQKCRIYIGAKNLITFTDYFNFDPEIGQNSNQGGSNQDLQLGIDQGVYPQPRTFLLGASITF